MFHDISEHDYVSIVFVLFVLLVFLIGFYQSIVEKMKYKKWEKEKQEREKLEKQEMKKKIDYAFRELSNEEKTEIERIKSEYMNCVQIQHHCDMSFIDIYYMISPMFREKTILETYTFLDREPAFHHNPAAHTRFNVIKRKLYDMFLKSAQHRMKLLGKTITDFTEYNGLIEKMARHYTDYMIAKDKMFVLKEKLRILIPYCGPDNVPPILKDCPEIL